jgi:hypothetical protein
MKLVKALNAAIAQFWLVLRQPELLEIEGLHLRFMDKNAFITLNWSVQFHRRLMDVVENLTYSQSVSAGYIVLSDAIDHLKCELDDEESGLQAEKQRLLNLCLVCQDHGAEELIVEIA